MDPYSKVAIGRVLRTRRKRVGLTLLEAAQAVGVSRASFGRLEQGKRALHVDALPTLAVALELAGPLDLLHLIEQE